MGNTNITWVGGTGNNHWSNANNWSPKGAPSSTTNVIIDNTSAAGTITFDVATPVDIGTLKISGGQTLAIGANTLNAAGVTVTAGFITIEGGDLGGSGAVVLATGASIVGSGAVSAVNGIEGTGLVEASGGTLDITGAIANGGQLAINGANGGNLLIGGSAITSDAISLSSGNQTLEIGSSGSLTIKTAETTSGGTIQLDGGALTDLHGLTLGGDLTGHGAVTTGATASTEFSGGGTVTASGGTLTFADAVDPTGTTATNFDIAAGSTLAFDGAVSSDSVDPTVTFAGAGTGTLDLSNAGAFNVTVDNFAKGNSIDVANGSTVTQGVGANADEITVTYGKTVDTIHMSSSADAAAAVAGYSNGVITTDAICFMAGTMIRTPDGQVAVETLERGDIVLTAGGLAKPVSWLGRQTVSTVFADPLRVWPVRIKAGAIDDNVPSRDLVVSPAHAILVDGALINAGALVNGSSVVRETQVPEIFTYYHVELDDHSLILAENTPAETFIDNIDRLAFDNWSEHEALYPDGKPIVEMPYPRAKAHRQVPVATRVRLAERADFIGKSTSSAVA